jgi:hypothetical protein
MKMVFTLEQDIFIGMAYFRTGNFDAADGWQYSTEHGRYIAPISTNVPRATWYFGRRGTLVAAPFKMDLDASHGLGMTDPP